MDCMFLLRIYPFARNVLLHFEENQLQSQAANRTLFLSLPWPVLMPINCGLGHQACYAVSSVRA